MFCFVLHDGRVLYMFCFVLGHAMTDVFYVCVFVGGQGRHGKGVQERHAMR